MCFCRALGFICRARGSGGDFSLQGQKEFVDVGALLALLFLPRRYIWEC